MGHAVVQSYNMYTMTENVSNSHKQLYKYLMNSN